MSTRRLRSSVIWGISFHPKTSSQKRAMSPRPASSRASAGMLIATWLNRGYFLSGMGVPFNSAAVSSIEPGGAGRFGPQAAAQREGHEDAEQEPAHVGDPRHARGRAGEELQHEP